MISPFRLCAILLPGIALTPTADAGMEVIAHRGAMMLAPENTLASQRLAYELGAEYAEVDVRVSADGVPFNLHDHDLDRTTNGTGTAGYMTMAQLKQFDAGIKFHPRFAGERIPTIAENLEVARQYNRKLMFDVKGQFMDQKLVEVIKQSGISLNQIALLTYWDGMTEPYAAALPGAKMMRAPQVPATGASIAAVDVTAVDLERLRQQKITTLIFGTGSVSKKDIDRFHDAGFEVSGLYHPQATAYYYQDIGLDSFWTDYPDVTVSNLNRGEQQWDNWAQTTGLAPDQLHTWMDPDGDGMDNLTEFTMGTHPLEPGPIPMTASLARDGIGWTVDLRENWSEFATARAQNSLGGPWFDLPPSSLTVLSPTRLKFQTPVTTGKQFFRMKFELIK